jgi:hypothetical protein
MSSTRARLSSRWLRAVLTLAMSVAACDRAKHVESQPRTEPLTEQQAAKATEIDGLRLVHASDDQRLANLDVQLGYVIDGTHPGGGRYFCGGMATDESRSAAGVIADALSRLPDGSATKLGLRFVILCSSALADGKRIGGIPVPPLDLLLLNVGAGGNNEAYLQHIFLHELFHFIEFRDNTFQDRDWQSRFGAGYLNSYGTGGERTTVGSGKRGFLNSYSETFPHEERAELFASMLLDATAVAAHVRATNDDMLRDKVRYVADKCARLGVTVQGL